MNISGEVTPICTIGSASPAVAERLPLHYRLGGQTSLPRSLTRYSTSGSLEIRSWKKCHIHDKSK